MMPKKTDLNPVQNRQDQCHVGSAPVRHRAQTPNCPSVPRLCEAMKGGWTAEEKEHVRQCAFCQKMMVMFWELEPSEMHRVAQYLAGIFPYAEALWMYLAKESALRAQTHWRRTPVRGLAQLIKLGLATRRLFPRLRISRLSTPILWAALAAGAIVTTVHILQTSTDRNTHRELTPPVHKAPDVTTNPPLQRKIDETRVPHTGTGEGPVVDTSTEAECARAELRIRYEMFTRRWDLVEDLAIGRRNGQVSIAGTASTAERAEEIRSALTPLQHVIIEVQSPDTPGPSATPIGISPGEREEPLLMDIMTSGFASVEARQHFIQSVLAASDQVLAHAIALNRLAKRYTESEIAILDEESRHQLSEMLVAHIQQLLRANNTLDSLNSLLPVHAEPRAEDGLSDWRGVAVRLFDAARRQDHVVAALVVSSSQDLRHLRTAAFSFAATHDLIRTSARRMLVAPEFTNTGAFKSMRSKELPKE